LHQVKSLLGTIFKLAIAQGYRPGPNPVRETVLPKGKPARETIAYTLDEVVALIRALPEPARTCVAVAGFAGLRRSEIQGLMWEDYTGTELRIERGVVDGVTGECKSKSSKASIPVVGVLRQMLDAHRVRSGFPEAGVMFRTATGKNPLCMNNVLQDSIRPLIYRCRYCGKLEAKHGREIHKYERDESLPVWAGWHSLRRGLASNLYVGVPDMTIQRILRHANVATTQAHYIKTSSAQSVAAMQKLDELLEKSTAILPLCNESATEAPSPKLVQ
jgi:integrase